MSSSEFALLHCTLSEVALSRRGRMLYSAAAPRGTPAPGGAEEDPAPGGAGVTATVLFNDIGADLADRRVLVAGTAAATDRANQLAIFHERKSTGACN